MLIELSGIRGNLDRGKSEVGNLRGAFKDKFLSLEERILALEFNKNMEQKEQNKGPFLIVTTCAITRIPFEELEDLSEKCSEFIRRGLELDDIEVVNMVHVGRREGRPGVIKIEVSSKVQKIKMLRAKRKLKDKERYKRWFLHSSKPLEQRLQESQTTEIHRAIGLGKLYFFNDMGRRVRKKEPVDADDHRIEFLNETDAQPRLQKEEKKYCEQRENRNRIKTNISNNSKKTQRNIKNRVRKYK